eukprot:4747927-Pleurochrysis_carterae.AAC.1
MRLRFHPPRPGVPVTARRAAALPGPERVPPPSSQRAGRGACRAPRWRERRTEGRGATHRGPLRSGWAMGMAVWLGDGDGGV